MITKKMPFNAMRTPIRQHMHATLKVGIFYHYITVFSDCLLNTTTKSYFWCLFNQSIFLKITPGKAE